MAIITASRDSNVVVVNRKTVLAIEENRPLVVTGAASAQIGAVVERKTIVSAVSRGPQGPQGDKGDPGDGVITTNSAVNGSGELLEYAAPVYRKPDGSIERALPVAGRYAVMGLALAELGIGIGSAGLVQIAGSMVGTLTQWGDVGQIGGLVPGARYFLGSDGRITPTAPVDTAQFLVVIGRALSSTELFIDIEPAIGL